MDFRPPHPTGCCTSRARTKLPRDVLWKGHAHFAMNTFVCLVKFVGSWHDLIIGVPLAGIELIRRNLVMKNLRCLS